MDTPPTVSQRRLYQEARCFTRVQVSLPSVAFDSFRSLNPLPSGSRGSTGPRLRLQGNRTCFGARERGTRPRLLSSDARVRVLRRSSMVSPGELVLQSRVGDPLCRFSSSSAGRHVATAFRGERGPRTRRRRERRDASPATHRSPESGWDIRCLLYSPLSLLLQNTTFACRLLLQGDVFDLRSVAWSLRRHSGHFHGRCSRRHGNLRRFNHSCLLFTGCSLLRVASQ